MSLRLQLLLVSLLTLVLPWAGCQFLRETESALRATQEATLLGSARTVASVLEDRTDLLDRERLSRASAESAAVLYGHALEGRISIDGYMDDWGIEPEMMTPMGDAGGVRYIAGVDRRFLYLFITVEDSELRYEALSSRAPADRVLLTMTSPAVTRTDLLLSTSAPGPIFATTPKTGDVWAPGTGREPRIQGNWQETAEGYNLELRAPLNMLGDRLGLEVMNARTVDPPTISGTWTGDSLPGPLIYPVLELRDALETFEQSGLRIRAVDSGGWQIASVGRLAPLVPDETRQPLLERLYRTLLAGRSLGHAETTEIGRVRGAYVDTAVRGTCDTGGYRVRGQDAAVVAAACPLVVAGQPIGAIVLEQTSEPILTLTNQALTRLVNVTLVATLIAAAVLLGFATLLSLRIRRLRNAAELAIGPDGQLAESFPASRARDELGDLSRSFADLLHRLRGYTEYLRSMTARLAHELRTPLTIVQSSLENLDDESLTEVAKTYTARASKGAERLGAMLRSMSEASKTEQSIESARPEPFDLTELAAGAFVAYQDAFPSRRFTIELPNQPCPLVGVPELIMQMLDKLVDNAIDFSPENGLIGLSLTDSDHYYDLRVENEGPALPEQMRGQLFDSMVSVREQKSEMPHLGLGLFIVRLIVAFHHGQVFAENREDGTGVVFTVRLPRISEK